MVDAPAPNFLSMFLSCNFVSAFGNLGSVLNSQGRISEAEWAYRQALLHRPNMADVHYNLWVIL